MHKALPRRPRHPDLIPRPPLGGVGIERQWSALIIDPAHQLRALAELRERDLISAQELTVLRRRILAAEPDGPDAPSQVPQDGADEPRRRR
jgi:Rad3-related DNA helicase